MTTIKCPKCRRETSFEMPRDAIDEDGEIYRCQHRGWPFHYKSYNKEDERRHLSKG